MSKTIAENCLTISIAEVNKEIGGITKQEFYDWNVPPEKQDEKWNLSQYFALEKPEWRDQDDWDTMIAEIRMDNIIMRYPRYPQPPYHETEYLTIQPKTTDDGRSYLLFTHKVTLPVELAQNQWGEAYERVDKSYAVPLTTVPQKYGGVRWYFRCALQTGSGKMCNRRVSKLYKPRGANYYGCRHCYNLSYASRNVSRSGRPDILGRLLSDYGRELEELQQKFLRRFGGGEV